MARDRKIHHIALTSASDLQKAMASIVTQVALARAASKYLILHIHFNGESDEKGVEVAVSLLKCLMLKAFKESDEYQICIECENRNPINFKRFENELHHFVVINSTTIKR